LLLATIPVQQKANATTDGVFLRCKYRMSMFLIDNLQCDICDKKFQGYLKECPLVNAEYLVECPKCGEKNRIFGSVGWHEMVAPQGAVEISKS